MLVKKEKYTIGKSKSSYLSIILTHCSQCSIFKHEPGAVVVMIVWWLNFQLHVQSVPITTNVVISNPAHGEVYSIQHYVVKFVSDLRQVGGFVLVLRCPPPIKLTATIKLKYC